ncbi:hypothetical protein I204_06947 [Kwoniella mangroviensis CBS 8886]|nr:hypothetical protein I204_06947 [Kwoniella mangroviensis CBS 8886]
MQTNSEEYGSRDLVGYGFNPPNPEWPDGAKIAISLVLNYEEGSEHTVVNGDEVSETLAKLGPGVTPHVNQRDVNMESLYEYGSRAGVWRILRLFQEKSVKCTAYAVGQALEMNPEVGQVLKEHGHEFASHGWRWIDRSKWTVEEEEANVRKTIRAIEKASGAPPKGWYYGMVGSKASPRSRALVAEVFREEGIPLEYWCDDYSDDLPYWIPMPGGQKDQGLLVIPYTLDTNDYKNATYQPFTTSDDFYTYLKDGFDELYREGSKGSPKMLSIGLHCRIVGRPARIAGLRKFIEYAQFVPHNKPSERGHSHDDHARDMQRMKSDVVVLQKRMQEALRRIGELECASTYQMPVQRTGVVGADKRPSLINNAPSNDTSILNLPDLQPTTFQQSFPPQKAHASTIAGTIQNGTFSSAPIQTLRGLIARPPTDNSDTTLSCTPRNREVPSTSAHDDSQRNDPISRGILTTDEAQRLFDIFFEACHELAPCSWITGQRDAEKTREKSSFLFTSICLIGARIRSTHNWLHPRYPSLVSLFDEHIQLLLLHPSSRDFTCEVVQSLLLSIQWPAVDIDLSSTSSSTSTPKSRFTDSYAWLMIGLATRFAKYIALEEVTHVDFGNSRLDEEKLQKMRVWLNLISVDRHLTLTAGLPATLVAPPTSLLRAFGSHPKAQSGDLKLAGLAELVAIVHRASISCGDVSLKKLDSITLSVANAELDSWEREWNAIFSGNRADPTFKQQMPFTALRWYRLALNALPIGVELGDIEKGTMSPTPAALKTGVDAAFRLLWQ